MTWHIHHEHYKEMGQKSEVVSQYFHQLDCRALDTAWSSAQK